MKNTIIKIIILFILPVVFFTACTNDNLIPVYQQQKAGKVVLRGYNASQDSIQIMISGKPLVINKHDAFVKKIESNYEFVFYDNKDKTIDIINKKTKKILHTYNFTTAKPIDTLSFFTKENIWISSVLSDKPGVLSATGLTGYKFIFPSINLYSNSGYNGPLDAVIRKTNGQIVGVAENITKDHFSSFSEFTFSLPPIIDIELVKHGTNESYVTDKRIIFRTVMQKNKSNLIVFEEKTDANANFYRVEGLINLTDYFTF